MTLKLHNTLTKKTEPFVSLTDGKATLYTCGPTVYNYPTVGNWVPYIYWDILVRVLRSAGYTVERVMNITDVGHLVSDADEGEDKLEKGARRENKTAWEVADFYTQDFLDGMKTLGLIPPEYVVKATDFIPQQFDLVRTLKEKGYTYQTTDGIYFDTSKFPAYADFANLDLEAQKAGARVEENTEKRQPWDFALWKFTPAGEKRDMEWATPDDLLDLPPASSVGLEAENESPVMGFPGWHLECSAMAISLLGPSIDVHTGGIDHIPVHHTNEIAQSEAATGQVFARYWLHNNHLKIDGGKISKSLENGYTLQDLTAKGFTAIDLRMFILQGHYRSEGNFTFENLQAAKNRLENWRAHAVLRHQTHDRLVDDTVKNDDPGYVSLLATSGAIAEALHDDLNTPKALAVVDEAFARLDTYRLEDIHRYGVVKLVDAIDELLGLQLADSTPDIDQPAKQLILERERARENKNWQRSDEIREELQARGITLRDTPSGAVWSYSR